jgi:hypothetical protein
VKLSSRVSACGAILGVLVGVGCAGADDSGAAAAPRRDVAQTDPNDGGGEPVDADEAPQPKAPPESSACGVGQDTEFEIDPAPAKPRSTSSPGRRIPWPLGFRQAGWDECATRLAGRFAPLCIGSRRAHTSSNGATASLASAAVQSTTSTRGVIPTPSFYNIDRRSLRRFHQSSSAGFPAVRATRSRGGPRRMQQSCSAR